VQGTFLVVEADTESAVLRAVDTGQVVTLSDDPGVAAGEVIDATVEPDETGIAYTATVEGRRDIVVEAVDDPPDDRAVAAADDADPGEVRILDGSGKTVHVLPVPPDQTVDAVRDILEDAATVERAARLGTDGVEVRSERGLVAVRYISSGETSGADSAGR